LLIGGLESRAEKQQPHRTRTWDAEHVYLGESIAREEAARRKLKNFTAVEGDFEKYDFGKAKWDLITTRTGAASARQSSCVS
jgi:hypothetical protein